MSELYQQFKNSSTSIKIAVVGVTSLWVVAIIGMIAIFVFSRESKVGADPSAPGVSSPTITLFPASGSLETQVTVHGQGWNTGSLVLIYLTTADALDLPGYATTSAVVDSTGQFNTLFTIPLDPQWENVDLVKVIARSNDGTAFAQSLFSLTQPIVQITDTPVLPQQPTVTTEMPVSTATAISVLPTNTPVSGSPALTTNTNLNVRKGPGTGYEVIGVLLSTQTAEITGLSPDRGWWQIEFTGVNEGRGWVSAKYVTAQNTVNVPIVQPETLPPTPTATLIPSTATSVPPTATPIVVIYDWRGEYYNNPGLGGNPVLVRNDTAINFSWGMGSPANGISVDNFSVRWTRSLYFAAGNYQFNLRVDDGARLWVDGQLVIDQWHDSSANTYSVNVNLSEGQHTLKVEYYDHGYEAIAQLQWSRIDGYPDWKAEYFTNRNVQGDPMLVRNEDHINYNWGGGSPASMIPSDNFSARWTHKLNFDAGTYRFQIKADDGVRLWIDDVLVLDRWQDQQAKLIEVDYRLDAGKHRLKIEYYEHNGEARIEVNWYKLAEPVNRPPQAIPGGPYTVNEGSSVTFDGRNSSDPDGRIVKYEWDFNYNGLTFNSQATGATVSVPYTDGPASNLIALRVTDDYGAINLATTQVMVYNVAPVVEAGGPYAGQPNATITFAATATDPGTIDQTGLVYRWDFGDTTTSVGPIVSHSYTQAGTYTARLTVIDKDGGQASDTANVTVKAVNQPPQAIITAPFTGTIGQQISFSGANSNDPDGGTISFAWNFGDGSVAQGVNVTHLYNNPGDYTVILTVTDNQGATSRASQVVQVTNPIPVPKPPVAVINGPVSGITGQPLTFDATNSFDSDGTIVSYAWDFGDTPTGSFNLPRHGVAAPKVEAVHTYNVPGIYSVKLTVTDNDGLSASTSLTTTIKAAVPTNVAPQAIITGPQYGHADQILLFSAANSVDNDGKIVNYSWNFGDKGIASTITTTHTYTQTGQFLVLLTVTDNGGLTAEAGQMIQIQLPIEITATVPAQ